MFVTKGDRSLEVFDPTIFCILPIGRGWWSVFFGDLGHARAE